MNLQNFVFDVPLIKKMVFAVFGGKLIWEFDDLATVLYILGDELGLDVGRVREVDEGDGIEEGGDIFLNGF